MTGKLQISDFDGRLSIENLHVINCILKYALIKNN